MNDSPADRWLLTAIEQHQPHLSLPLVVGYDLDLTDLDMVLKTRICTDIQIQGIN